MDLADKLKALGVKLGTADIAPPVPKTESGFPIETVVDGRWVETGRGEAFVSCQTFEPDYQHGKVPIGLEAPLNGVARWLGEARLQDIPVSALAFLDTETSGLAGGTGTYAFLVGAGRFLNHDERGQTFQLRQFFMREPTEEAAMLEALLEFLAPCQALVTFNGKAFDAPLLCNV
jgi:hypothetical protein